jgi:hypothetical protein
MGIICRALGACRHHALRDKSHKREVWLRAALIRPLQLAVVVLGDSDHFVGGAIIHAPLAHLDATACRRDEDERLVVKGFMGVAREDEVITLRIVEALGKLQLRRERAHLALLRSRPDVCERAGFEGERLRVFFVEHRARRPELLVVAIGIDEKAVVLQDADLRRDASLFLHRGVGRRALRRRAGLVHETLQALALLLAFCVFELRLQFIDDLELLIDDLELLTEPRKRFEDFLESCR